MSGRKRAKPGAAASWPIRPIMAAARDEAALARHGYLGLEHLFAALARPERGGVANLLADFGAPLPRARDAVWLVVGSGRGDGPRFDAASLLATLGIDLEQIRRTVERRFGPNAMHDLYSGPVGWNLRPRGPLCDLPLNPVLKRVISDVLGNCWGNAPRHLPERLLVAALDSGSPGLNAVLDELAVEVADLRRALTEQLKIAS